MLKAAPSKPALYTMSIDLSVLNHLGIGLYSNIPAVLSEAVANAWDADATTVSIRIDKDADCIEIIDNGRGMTTLDVNSKYLTVGYRKRDAEPGPTQGGRIPMGRKGIGKLSVFAIADIVEVYSIKDGERSALRMSREAIEAQISGTGAGDYHPEELDTSLVTQLRGTRIVLTSLKKRLNATEAALRKRLARRFTVIGAEHEFDVTINDQSITLKDRDFFDHIEFLWYFGDESADYVTRCRNSTKQQRVSNIVSANSDWNLKGWIGTVEDQKHIDEQNNTIIIFSHGKLIQEDLLTDLKEAGVYSKYIIGELDPV